MRRFLLFICLIRISLSASSFHAGSGKTVDVLHYVFNNPLLPLELDLDNKDMSGNGMIVSNITYNGEEIKWMHSDNLLRIGYAGQFIADSSFTLTVKYSGIPSDGLILLIF